MKRRVTREEIIRTTRDLIIRNGIRAVRVDEIAQKLEISKRTLYELFSDKDTLVEQCWDKIREEQEKKIAGYLFYQPGSALEQARNLIQEYIAAVCMISCISLQELQQKVSYADSYEKNRRFWLDSFTEVLEHCVADGSVLPDVDCQLFAKRLMNVLLGLYLEGGTRREMDAFGGLSCAESPLTGASNGSTEKSRTPDIFHVEDPTIGFTENKKKKGSV